jgi:hypothetical protein
MLANGIFSHKRVYNRRTLHDTSSASALRTIIIRLQCASQTRYVRQGSGCTLAPLPAGPAAFASKAATLPGRLPRPHAGLPGSLPAGEPGGGVLRAVPRPVGVGPAERDGCGRVQPGEPGPGPGAAPAVPHPAACAAGCLR